VLTHDVERVRGLSRCTELMEREKSLGLFSSFNFVAEGYEVPSILREQLSAQGFEVGLHGLKHDGKLYQSYDIFCKRALRINHLLKEWNAVGFRSPSMHHNLSWLHRLDLSYDLSTFDTDPFEPQSNGVGTIFPFFVRAPSSERGFVEMPYTLPQDYTLFVLLRMNNISIWKTKLDWIVEKGGMALLNTHPDYMSFSEERRKPDEYTAEHYLDFLEYIKIRYNGMYWNVLPREMAQFWRTLKACDPENPVSFERVEKPLISFSRDVG